MRRSRAVLALALLALGCETAVTVSGRAFGTRESKEAGVGLVDERRRLDEFDDAVLWPLSGVRVSCPHSTTADGDGFFEVRCAKRHVLVTPISVRLVCSREGYRTESRTFWLSEMDRELIVVLLERPRPTP